MRAASKQLEHEAGVVAIFAKAMFEGRSLKIFGDGREQRDYVFIGDAVEAIFKSSESKRSGPFNVGTGIGTSTNQIFAILASQFGYTKLPVNAPPRAGDIRRISLDCRKAAEELGWIPEMPLEEGLKVTLEWFGSEESP